MASGSTSTSFSKKDVCFQYFLLILKQVPWKENQKILCWKMCSEQICVQKMCLIICIMSLATASYDTLYTCYEILK